MNWKWPSGPGSPYEAWYVIAWRAAWWPFVCLSRYLFVLFVLVSYGPDMAREAWRRTE